MERIKKIGKEWFGFCNDCKRDERKMINKTDNICISCWNKRKFNNRHNLENIYVNKSEIEVLLNKIKNDKYSVDAIGVFEILNMWLNITRSKVTKYDDFHIEEQLIMMITDIMTYYKKSK